MFTLHYGHKVYKKLEEIFFSSNLVCHRSVANSDFRNSLACTWIRIRATDPDSGGKFNTV
jgi:hypothetical protein